MKLTKTEQKLLEKARSGKSGAGYCGQRQSDAARKLEDKGLVERYPGEGFYWHRHRNGDYSRRYHPQGMIRLVKEN